MQTRHFRRIGLMIGVLFSLLSLACSMSGQLPLLGEENNSSPLATRTPLPTFTATAAIQVQVSIPPTPTNTPPLPPTATPAPPTNTPEPAAATNTPEPEPTNTPEPAPTEPPPPPPPPTEPPPPPPEPEPAGPVVGANGVIGSIEFRDGRDTYGVGEKVFVRIEAKLPGAGGQKPFGVLGLTASNGQFQTSWSSGTIDGTFRHEDGLAFSSPGQHQLWLSICFSTLQECQGTNGNWERFEPGLTVNIQ